MTATHDKEWKEGTWHYTDTTTSKIFSHPDADYEVIIPQSLLDQIRRDAVDEYKKKGSWELTAQSVQDIEQEAKKELLDEIENLYYDNIRIPYNVFHGIRCNIVNWKNFRAKTLGEKNV